MPLWLDQAFLKTVDALYALPRHRPTAAQLEAVAIVSHRGQRDAPGVLENTYAAFDPLRGSGVFGLEFDVRWTRDLVPVVFHDADFLRLYGSRARLADLGLADVLARFPQVPTLHELVRRYSGEFHLMVELKAERYPDPGLQDRRLAEALAPALASSRCHVLSLAPEMFARLPSLPAARTLGIARLNSGAIGAEAQASKRGGFACHYAALRARHIRAHHGAGQRVGSGFPTSPALLYREAARGVDWVFTNRALQLERCRRQGPPPPAAGTPAPRR
ncbi:MAG: glycerophosphodiester phosphodiesterase [Gammaproteobacteria bacterium]